MPGSTCPSPKATARDRPGLGAVVQTQAGQAKPRAWQVLLEFSLHAGPLLAIVGLTLSQLYALFTLFGCTCPDLV